MGTNVGLDSPIAISAALLHSMYIWVLFPSRGRCKERARATCRRALTDICDADIPSWNKDGLAGRAGCQAGEGEGRKESVGVREDLSFDQNLETRPAKSVTTRCGPSRTRKKIQWLTTIFFLSWRATRIEFRYCSSTLCSVASSSSCKSRPNTPTHARGRHRQYACANERPSVNCDTASVFLTKERGKKTWSQSREGPFYQLFIPPQSISSSPTSYATRPQKTYAPIKKHWNTVLNPLSQISYSPPAARTLSPLFRLFPKRCPLRVPARWQSEEIDLGMRFPAKGPFSTRDPGGL